MKTYLIAEVGSTHDGSLGNALRSIEVFARLGANAVKFQDHRWQDVPIDCFGKPLHAEHPQWFQGPPIESRQNYLARTCFDQDQWKLIHRGCALAGVDLIVSPFSAEAANSLVELVSAFKVASGQVTNQRLLKRIVELGRPVHLSSGMTTWEETQSAVELLKPVLRSVMHCVSEYPTPAEQWPLRELAIFGSRGQRAWWAPGWSDHSGGIIAPLLAVWEGAEVLEVHVTLSRDLYGSDAAHSLIPEMFAELVHGIEQVERARDSTVTREQRVELLAETRKQFLHHA